MSFDERITALEENIGGDSPNGMIFPRVFAVSF